MSSIILPCIFYIKKRLVNKYNLSNIIFYLLTYAFSLLSVPFVKVTACSVFTTKKINQIEFEMWIIQKKRFTYSSQLNEYNNFESNSSIAKISGNIMFCIFDVFHRLNITLWIKNLSFSCLSIFNEVCFLVPEKSNIMWWHESLNRKENHNAYPGVSR